MAGATLPRFVIVGAAKAATSWIAHQLRQRSDVFMPGPEPHYFSREYHRGQEWYASLFDEAGTGQLVGEKSADYLADPQVPRRMADLLPDAQLIVQLRNPVERAYSDFCMLFRRGEVNGDVARHLDWTRTSAPRFLADGLYAQHIGRLRDHFPIGQIKVILHDDIRADPRRVVADVCTTLSIPSLSEARLVEARVNDARSPMVPMLLRQLPAPVKKLVAPLRGRRTFEAVRGWMARPLRYPPLVGETRKRLEDFYADDVAQLSRMLGRDLTHWVRASETVI